ncbi:unnamed protein product [Echinostoma caproni]|uniref:Uncharacterized protein n=1 Tax=Echinostoma caproni TaxID=27848 RepID=A0A183AX20_9TREM|nr:unnamed protein product [Echinostoma caproni]
MCSVGLFRQLKQAKDPIVLRGLNKYVKFRTKLALSEARIQFIDECVTKSEFPKQYWTLLRRNRVNITSATLRRLDLNERDTLCNHLVDLERNYVTSACMLDDLSPIERKSFEDYVQSIAAKQVERIQTTLRQRLSHVKPVALELEKLKSTLVNACYQHRSVKVKTSELVTPEHLKRLRDLQKNREIMMSKPDKGAGIVLLNRTDYLQKMKAILSDGSKFTKTTEKDKTAQIEVALSKILRCLKQNGVIDATNFERIRPTGTTIPRLRVAEGAQGRANLATDSGYVQFTVPRTCKMVGEITRTHRISPPHLKQLRRSKERAYKCNDLQRVKLLVLAIKGELHRLNGICARTVLYSKTCREIWNAIKQLSG